MKHSNLEEEMTIKEKAHLIGTLIISVAAYHCFVAFSLLYNSVA